jgi:hypothetical protein
MFIPWFDVEHVNGDTSWLSALSVTTVNDDHKKDEREIYTTNSNVVIKTKVSAHEIFERMGAAIKGAYDAEMEVSYPQRFIQGETAAKEPEAKDTLADDRIGEPIPSWVASWLEAEGRS